MHKGVIPSSPLSPYPLFQKWGTVNDSCIRSWPGRSIFLSPIFLSSRAFWLRLMAAPSSPRSLGLNSFVESIIGCTTLNRFGRTPALLRFFRTGLSFTIRMSRCPCSVPAA